MIKHVVLFKFKSSIKDNEGGNQIEVIKNDLLAVQDEVAELKYIEVGLNSNPDESYDLALITKFDSYDDLRSNSVHPEHVKAVGTIRQILEQRACVDFEV